MFAAGIRPGVRESEASALESSVLKALGMDRIRHPVIVRFGENMPRTFKERSVADRERADDDIFFVDLGVVWGRHEGDAAVRRGVLRRRARPRLRPGASRAPGDARRGRAPPDPRQMLIATGPASGV
ncbi:hypothetical protein [Burkholderia sp. Bp9143]|uniref:hypothetical protein n=1 Tax=Burkholderia sp. Bp9143 TaxID=2184574 RepID=UPI0021AB93FD|nr:hypothetical protein [Burkholderia sp. Bp9143]